MFRQLKLQIEAGGELDAIAGPQGMSDEERYARLRDLWHELDHPHGGDIRAQCRNGTIPLASEEGSLAAPTSQRGRYLHL